MTALYIHWPYCLAKCPYCDFNSHVAASIDHDRWAAAYLRGLEYYADLLPGRQIGSIFFGGGTPSLMAPDTVEVIITAVQKHWHISNDIEITLEANPTSIEADKFAAFRAAGVNRVSVGVQALDDPALKFLGREHSAAEARRAVQIAANTFDRFSFDLIYARPEQSLNDLRSELTQALEIAGEHLSLYQLTIERNTPFYNAHRLGHFMMPEEGLAADFYDLTQDIMEEAGLPAYEVSNHARPGAESRHNLTYWRYGDYIGLGPGAHGRLILDGIKHATREHQAPEIWLERTETKGSAAHPFEALSAEDQALERLMMGLRLREGIEIDAAYLDMERVRAAEKEGLLSLRERNALEAIQSGEDKNWIASSGYSPPRNDDFVYVQPTRAGWLRLNALIPFLMVQSDRAAA